MPKHLQLWQKQAVRLQRNLKEAELCRTELHGFSGDAEGLRAFLFHRYGGSVRGWREAIAPDRVGVKPVTFGEFCTGLQRIGYRENALTLWRNLSYASGGASVSLEDLEPDLAVQLDACAQRLAETFPGGAGAAWREIKPRAHGERVSYREFANFLVQHGLDRPVEISQGDDDGSSLDASAASPEHRLQMRRLFAALDGSGRGLITCEEFRFLDHWAARRLGLPFQAMQEMVDAPPQERWTPPAAPDRGEDEGPGLDAFRKLCEARMGSCARAWRVALDLRGHGELSCGEFGKGCRGLGWVHSHVHVWRLLRAEGDGRVTLRTLDPEAAKSIDDLNREVLEQYGDASTFWCELLDPLGSGAVSRPEFVDHVGKTLGLGMAAAKRIFTALDTQNSGWLAEAEVLWLEAFERNLEATSPPSAALSPHGCRSSDETPVASPANGPAPSCKSVGHGIANQIPRIASPAKRTRAQQHRMVAQTHAIKHRWVIESVMAERQAARLASPQKPSLSQEGFRKSPHRTADEPFRATT